MRVLSLLETRVVGVLVEKAHTVPDSYPLSLNALVLGCNQKTAREPVLVASEAEVLLALDTLKAINLVFESSGSRVARYEHNLGRALVLPSQSVALLATLMLRGPQTASELRIHSERLHRFADVSAAEGFLDELAARADDKGGPLALKLGRSPGSREARWVHLLCGTPEAEPSRSLGAAQAGDDGEAPLIALGEIAALQRRLAAAEAELARLRPLVDRLCSELGVATL